MRRHARERQEKIEKGRLISKRLRATLLRLVRGEHGKKMVCVRGVPRVTGTLKKANSHFDPTQAGSVHHHVETAVDCAGKNKVISKFILFKSGVR